jgi:hypothetical protein
MKKMVQMAVALAAFALSAGFAYAQSSPDLSRSELKKMVRSAHTADDYASLASYFKWRQEDLQQRARGELMEWAQLSPFGIRMPSKYPTPADASRNRYEYFTYEARQMSQKADYYENLAQTAPR